MGFQFTRKMDMAPFKDEVELGPSGESEAEQSLLYPARWYKPRFPRSVKSLLIIQWVIIALLSIPGVVSWLGLLKTAPSGDTPVQHLIRHRNVVYVAGFGSELSEYQGPPSPENNAAWSDLYNFGISRIPKSDAAHLVNKTVPIADDPGQYAISLDVFHQLHCLNMVRKRVWSTEVYLPEDELMGIEHIDHCIDTIRQSLMCAVDVTPLPFVWVERDQRVKEVAAVIHTCRDFDAIKDWAQEHHIKTFDRTKHVHDDLLD
ncbi:predicted protein [Aspergillus terreus NIH2624]|uniref:Tat pathway signal sequence n=1 Tax=Aspergillus terreus (strain NIH 2624 / FGSC A1156) TaxID=341663 RepID=Q0CFM7_ASPTN|nr:uncharacterized protein ATEG_07507 [Aspergillus terreus NIH2624]EAU31769.1 predicted protein [Aspergillus terreus NIH2624]